MSCPLPPSSTILFLCPSLGKTILSVLRSESFLAGGWEAGSEKLEMLFSPQGHLHHLSIQAAMSGFVLAILFVPKLEGGLD
jgi:hypothetical protein